MTADDIRNVNCRIQTLLNKALFVLELVNKTGDGNWANFYDTMHPWIKEAYDLSENTLSEVEEMIKEG